MDEIYVSTDIESDGPIPGVYSMLSLASAAFTADKKMLSTFSINLETLPDAQQHEKTMAWWKTQSEAWQACRKDVCSADLAMKKYFDWLKELPGKPVFIGYPASFDFLFVYWYLIRFVGESPFSFSALDIKTYAMAVLKTDYRKATKSNMPGSWFDPVPHTHVALDDAIEQGLLFCNMLNQNVGKDGRTGQNDRTKLENI
jgi:hypothetical protein